MDGVNLLEELITFTEECINYESFVYYCERRGYERHLIEQAWEENK